MENTQNAVASNAKLKIIGINARDISIVVPFRFITQHTRNAEKIKKIKNIIVINSSISSSFFTKIY